MLLEDVLEESDTEDEPPAEEELSALTAEGLRDMQVALKKIRLNGRGEAFKLEDRLAVLSTSWGSRWLWTTSLWTSST